MKKAFITGVTGQDGSYLAEFLLEKGFLDQIVPRGQLRERIAYFLTSFRAASQDMRWSL